MGIAVWFVMKQFDFPGMVFLEQLAVLFAAIVSGILVYVVLSLVFSHEDLRSLKEVFSRRDRSKDSGELQ